MCAQVKPKASYCGHVSYEVVNSLEVLTVFTTLSETWVFQAETMYFNTELQIFKAYYIVSCIDINLFIQ